MKKSQKQFTKYLIIFLAVFISASILFYVYSTTNFLRFGPTLEDTEPATLPTEEIESFGNLPVGFYCNPASQDFINANPELLKIFGDNASSSPECGGEGPCIQPCNGPPTLKCFTPTGEEGFAFYRQSECAIYMSPYCAAALGIPCNSLVPEIVITPTLGDTCGDYLRILNCQCALYHELAHHEMWKRCSNSHDVRNCADEGAAYHAYQFCYIRALETLPPRLEPCRGAIKRSIAIGTQSIDFFDCICEETEIDPMVTQEICSGCIPLVIPALKSFFCAHYCRTYAFDSGFNLPINCDAILNPKQPTTRPGS